MLISNSLQKKKAIQKATPTTRIKIYNFVEWELQKFRDECNFTDEELQCFELKAKNKSIEYIAQEMHISTAKVSVLVKRIINKIIKVV